MKIAWLFSALAFPIFALNRAYASAPPAKNVNKAEALRSFFEKSGAILPKPSGSAVNNDDILNEAMLGWISIKVYAHLEMEDTPKAVSESTFSCFRINFKKDPAAVCKTAPFPDVCNAVGRNCVAFGHALFCDVSYLERLGRISEAAYFTRLRRLALASEGRTIEMHENVNPFTMRNIASYEDRLSREDFFSVKPGRDLDEIHHVFECLSQGPSKELGKLLLASVVIGHEFSHLVEFALPAYEEDESLTGSMTRAYKSVTCQDYSKVETMADVRAGRFLEYPLQVAAGIDKGLLGMVDPNSTGQKKECNESIFNSMGLSMKSVESVKAKMDHENTSLLMLSLAAFVEYEIASFGGSGSALEAYDSAIGMFRARAPVEKLNDFFFEHAKRNLSPSNINQTMHGLPALRGLGLLYAAKFSDFWDENHKKGVPNSMLNRLSGLIAGQVAKASELGCKYSQDKSYLKGWTTVQLLTIPSQANNPSHSKIDSAE